MNKLVSKMQGSLRKNFPHILFGAGMAGTGVSIYLACKKTIELQPVIENHKKQVAEILPPLNDSDKKKEELKIYANTTKDLVKLYLGPAILYVSSIGAMFAGYKINNERLMSTAAALTISSATCATLENALKEKCGEDAVVEAKMNVTAKKDKKGNTVYVANTPDSFGDFFSTYSIIFDQDHSWNYEVHDTEDNSYNAMFLFRAQAAMNKKLHSKGVVWLSEVYDELGIKEWALTEEQRKAARVVGWSLNNPNSDGYISFGLNDERETVKEFYKGEEKVIILDFNVDGNILDIPSKIKY